MIKVFKYGVKPPVDFAEDTLSEMQRMNVLWNRLVEIDREREQGFRKLCCDFSPEYAEAMARIDALKEPIDMLYEEIRRERVKLRSTEPSPEIKARKDELLGERKALWETCKTIQKSLPKDMQKPLTEKYKADIKLARQNSGCFWGNYNAVIESFETAKSKAIKDGGRLHFKKFEGEGRFVNQIQGGLSAAELLAGSHSQVKLTDVVTTNAPRGQLTFTAFTGRDAEGKRFRRELHAQLTYHRPIPEEGVIKSVEVVRSLVGGKFKWHACFTVSLPDDEIVHPKRNVAGINLGWRQFGSQLRIAVLIDDKNQKREYYLPAQLVNKFAHAEKLQKQADDAQNDMLAWLREFYHAQSAHAPQDWKEAAQLILRSKTPQSAYGELKSIWAGCIDVFDSLEQYEQYSEWLKQDKRLRNSHTGARRRAVAWREELYRNFAKEIADAYAVIGVSDMPLMQMSRTKSADGLSIKNELPEAARRNRVIAGVYTFKEWLDKQAAKSGASIEKITAKVTQTCHRCGTVNEKPVGAAQYFTCTGCAHELDVDVNAATNCRKLASGEVAPKQKTAKTPKYKRVREAMKDRNDSARENGDNAANAAT